MRKVLFISPHLDDVVFSCAARIFLETKAGSRVIVATVFSHARGSAQTRRRYAARRQEDRRALRLLGAEPLWMGMIDAPFRSPFYDSFNRLVFGATPRDGDQIQIIRDAINKLVRDFKSDLVYLPLAVGTHIDHRLVFEAAMGISAGCNRIFYEDQPYASVRYATLLRLKEIRAASSMRNGNPYSKLLARKMAADFFRSFRAAPYVRRYLPPGTEQRQCESNLRRKWSSASKPAFRAESEIEAGDPSDKQHILKALYAYQSQARLFLGSRKQFVLASENHARELGISSWRAERFWKLRNRP